MLAQVTSEELILQSAREELARTGILGLRVASVAEGAHCSITNIYRYFGDRDGLLARVLGDMYEEFTAAAVATFMARLNDHKNLTVRDIARALPFPTSESEMKIQAFRMQILATSTENQRLRDRLQKISKMRAKVWQESFAELDSKMAPGERYDRRVFRVMLANFAPYYNSLLGDMQVTAEEFYDFVEDKLRLK